MFSEALIGSCDCAARPSRMRFRTADARQSRAKQDRQWQRSKKAEASYAAQLRGVATQIGKFVNGLYPDDPVKLSALERLLNDYAQLITPWATETAARMIAEVDRGDVAMWEKRSAFMSREMTREIETAPTGKFLKDKLAENVGLITSLPRGAAQRVHDLAIEGVTATGARANTIRDEILRSGEVSRSRATLIARTEVAHVASGLIESRAQHVGSEGYIWRTVGDADVRNTDGNPVGSHRLLDGKFIKWNAPPIAATNGVRAHAGQIYNCRCWPDPVIPSEFGPTTPLFQGGRKAR